MKKQNPMNDTGAICSLPTLEGIFLRTELKCEIDSVPNGLTFPL